MNTQFSSPLPSLFFEPRRYRPHGVGYWSGHIPFGCDLIATLRPRRLVELGTHMGESYFSLCQAAEENGLDLEAFAVDTWRGDQHTGAYSDAVWEEISQTNQLYPFSRLLRSTFDEAVTNFADRSIDLLHIDGAHVYEAVRHDFETWWPKVSEGGIVLLHDANERGHDFGVWRFLDELRKQFPAGEFLHSHGLGVVAKPPLWPSVAADLLTAQPTRLAIIRRYYETCAAGMRTRHFARYRTPSHWEIIAQLLWRSNGQAWTESASVRASELVGPEPLTIPFPIPNQRAIHELRVVPALEPAIVRVHSIRVEDLSGKPLFEQTMEQVRVDKEASQGYTFPAPAGLENGGRALLSISGVDPMSLQKPPESPRPEHSRFRRLFSKRS